MKKVLLLAAFAGLLITACEKDEDDDNNNGNTNSIIGSWVTHSLSLETKLNGITVFDSTENYNGLVFTFNSDGSVYLNVDETVPTAFDFYEDDTSYYNKQGNTLYVLDAANEPIDSAEAVLTIQTLTSTELVLSQSETDTIGGMTGTTEVTVNCIKQ